MSYGKEGRPLTDDERQVYEEFKFILDYTGNVEDAVRYCRIRGWVSPSDAIDLRRRVHALEQLLASLSMVEVAHQMQPGSAVCWANCACCLLARAKTGFAKLGGTETRR